MTERDESSKYFDIEKRLYEGGDWTEEEFQWLKANESKYAIVEPATIQELFVKMKDDLQATLMEDSRRGHLKNYSEADMINFAQLYATWVKAEVKRVYLKRLLLPAGTIGYSAHEQRIDDVINAIGKP